MRTKLSIAFSITGRSQSCGIVLENRLSRCEDPACPKLFYGQRIADVAGRRSAVFGQSILELDRLFLLKAEAFALAASQSGKPTTGSGLD